MSNGISVSLPLIYDKADGPYLLNKTSIDSIRQNFKGLILTAKGERIMDPGFGIGIYSFLFENYYSGTEADIRREVDGQLAKYLPFISILEFKVEPSQSNINKFNIYIRYSVSAIGALDELSFVINGN